MAYQKQTWRDFDDTKTDLQNINNGAVVTPERLNHIENGIANSADKAEVTAQLQHIETTKAEKTQTDSIQGQVNNLVLGAIEDGSNAEVVQARGAFALLNERLLDTDNTVGLLTDMTDKKYTEIPLTIINNWIQPNGTTDTYNNNIHAEYTVNSGEEYLIKCRTGSNTRPYVLKDSGGVVLLVAAQDATYGQYHDYDVYLKIPRGVINGVLNVNSFTSGYIGLKKMTAYNLDGTNLIDNTVGGNKLTPGSIDLTKLSTMLTPNFSESYTNQTLTFLTGYMQTSGVLSDYASAKYAVLDVVAGEKYRVTAVHGSSVKAYVLITASGTVNSYYPVAHVTGVNTETVDVVIPEGVTKMYVSTYGMAATSAFKLTGYSLTSPTNPLLSKKVVFFGDSITAGAGSWADSSTIAIKNNMSSTNYGVGGSTYTVKVDSNDVNNIYLRLQSKYALSSDADYVILQGGVNDAFQGLPVGVMLSATDFTTACDTATFAGAFEMALRYALTNWVGAKVGFIVNCKIPRNSNLGTYMAMAKQICEKYSVPYLDLFNYSGLNAGIQSINDAYFLIDTDYSTEHSGGTHPTPLGYAKYLNNKVENWLGSL